MATIADLLVKLQLDGQDFTDGIEKARSQVGFLDSGLTGLAGIGGGILAAGVGAAVAGLTALGVGLYQSVKAAGESQDVQAQLQAVLKSTGGVAGVSADQVNDLATQLSGLTKFDDEAIVSAESLLLTFTSIGKDKFPQATSVVLDMSQALGQDLKSSAIQLGKALQDPVLGVTALRRVGVNFNDEQQNTIKNLVATGKLEQAQALILKELQTEFGGSAQAAGKTFGGQLAILETKLGNIKETIGGALLPVLQGLASFFIDKLSQPATLAFIQQLAQGIQNFAVQVYNYIPLAYQWIVQAFGWLQDHQGLIVAALAVIGASIVAFGISIVVALVGVVPVFLPILAVILLIGGAAYLLYTAWTQNWGGIQQTTAAVWAAVQPVLSTLLLWLQTNIPIAVQALAGFWTGTLWPAILAVWGWMQSTLFPFFQALGELVGVLLVRDVEAWTIVWETRAQPALQAIWSFLQNYVWPILQVVGGFIGNEFASAFYDVTLAIQGVTSALQTMASWLKNIKLPTWLTPGSPTPLELGLRGIADAMGDVNSLSFGGSGLVPAGARAQLAASSGPINVYITSPGIIDEQDVARRLAPALDAHLSQRGLI